MGVRTHYDWPAAICVALYALGSWIIINGLWNELPLLINVLPEGWKLPAYIVIIIQIANIGPIVYVPLSKLCRSQKNGFLHECFQPPERFVNYTILSVGLLASILLANLWNVTVQFSPTLELSVGLLVMTLFVAVVDCTSSVSFYAYLAGMSQAYIGALSLGEAFCDLLPSLVALIQGVGVGAECIVNNVTGQVEKIRPEPRFSITIYLYILSSMLAVSLLAFTLLDCAPWGLGKAVRNNYFAQLRQTSRPSATSSVIDVTMSRSNELTNESTGPTWPAAYSTTTGRPDATNNTMESTLSFVSTTSPPQQQSTGNFSLMSSFKSHYIAILSIAYISAMTNGFLPPLQPYSSAVYSTTTHHLVVNLSGLAVACAIVLTTRLVTAHGQHPLEPSPLLLFDRPLILTSLTSLNRKWIMMAGLSSIPAAYVIVIASTSPHPPMADTYGPALSILAWVLLRVGFIALRTWIWLTLSARSAANPMLLRVAGLATQLGAVLGSVMSFLLITQVFVAKEDC